MSKMLKLLAFVEKSDKAKTIKNAKLMGMMDARIKELLPDIIKKRESDEHERDWGGKVNKSASSRRRRYAETDSRPFEVGKGTRGRRGKTRTVYTPPPGGKTEARRKKKKMHDELARVAFLIKRDKAKAEYDKGMARIQGPLQREMLAFLGEEDTYSLPDDMVMAHITKLYDEAARKKEIDDRTREKQSEKIQTVFRSWIKLKEAKKKIAEEQRRAAAITKIQAAQRRKAAKAKVDEMRTTADRDAERELTEMEEEAVDEPFSIPGESTATYTTLLNNKFKDSLTEQPLLRVKRIRDNGDCLFEALVYFIRRVGDATRHIKSPATPSADRGIWYRPQAVEVVLGILDAKDRIADPDELLNFQIKTMRDYLANSVVKNWTESQPSLNKNSYMTFLDESAGGGGRFKDRSDYLIHMTSKNEDDAKSNLSETEYDYKLQGRYGGVPELLEFQRLFNTKVQIIKGQKNHRGTPSETTELRFDGFDGLFKVNEYDIFDTKVMTLIFYIHSTNAVSPFAEPSPHYELIELTEAGEAFAKSREDLSLLEELDEEEGKKSSAAPAISSEGRKRGDCVQFTYPDGGVVRGITIDDAGIKIKGLYVGRDGKTMWGITPAFEPGDELLKDWAPTGEEFRTFFQTYKQHFAEKIENISIKYEKLNASIDRMPKIKEIMIERVKKLKKILEIEKERPSETTRGRLVTAKRSLNLTKQKLKTEIDKLRREGVIKPTFDSILKLFGQRDTVRNDWKKLNSAKKNADKIIPMLKRCVKRKGGKRKRKTKRKRRKRKKKKSTRRKR